jgi:hypothetical protein
MLGEIAKSTDSTGALERLQPRLQLLRGYAMHAESNEHGARECFESAIAIARQRRDRFELLLALDALLALDRIERRFSPADLVKEKASIMGELKIQRLPLRPLYPCVA